jgi:hypothetical protein
MANPNSDDPKKKDESADDSKSILSETIKKVFAAGVTAAFMTEESVRTHLGDIKIPKDILNLLLQQANRSKEELVQRVTKEILSMVNKIDLVSEFSKFAESHKFKITAEIDITRKDKVTVTDPKKHSKT